MIHPCSHLASAIDLRLQFYASVSQVHNYTCFLCNSGVDIYWQKALNKHWGLHIEPSRESVQSLIHHGQSVILMIHIKDLNLVAEISSTQWREWEGRKNPLSLHTERGRSSSVEKLHNLQQLKSWHLRNTSLKKTTVNFIATVCILQFDSLLKHHHKNVK